MHPPRDDDDSIQAALFSTKHDGKRSNDRAMPQGEIKRRAGRSLIDTALPLTRTHTATIAERFQLYSATE